MRTHRKNRYGSRSRALRVEVLEPRHVLSAGIGVFNPGLDKFFLRNEASAGTPTAGEFQFSAQGSTPVVGDWNGDGKEDFGIVDATTATWSLRYGAESGSANAGVF